MKSSTRINIVDPAFVFKSVKSPLKYNLQRDVIIKSRFTFLRIKFTIKYNKRPIYYEYVVQGNIAKIRTIWGRSQRYSHFFIRTNNFVRRLVYLKRSVLIQFRKK